MSIEVTVEVDKEKRNGVDHPVVELDIPIHPTGLEASFQSNKAVMDAQRGWIMIDAHGTVSYEENTVKDSLFIHSDFNDQCPENLSQSIVLVLESPHRYEYEGTGVDIRPKGPAQGQSPGRAGGAIDRYIREIIQSSGFIYTGRFPLVISNPVQYQASLFHLLGTKKINRNIRDEVWNKIWSLSEIQDDFFARLISYEPAMILNACTLRYREKITSFLVDKGYGDRFFETYHPAINWNCGRRYVIPRT